MSRLHRNVAETKVAGPILAIFALCSLGGCSAGDVELNGKIFELAGLSGNQNSRGVPKMKNRTGLIVPPDTTRLPQPGEKAPVDTTLATLNDPDAAKIKSAEQKKREQDAYCKKHYEPAIARGDDSADAIQGPHGPCRKSVFDLVGGVSVGGAQAGGGQ